MSLKPWITWEKLSAWRQRSKQLGRHTPIRPFNPERKARRKAAGDVYGPYHEWAESLVCVSSVPQEYQDPADPMGWAWAIVNSQRVGRVSPLHACRRYPDRKAVEGHHVLSVGAGGRDFANELPCCNGLHDDLHDTANGATKPVGVLTPDVCRALAYCLSTFYPGDENDGIK